jgi:hypothetical protein
MDTSWGREIVELEDLRFVHRIMTTPPNTASWWGVDTTVFMVDFAALLAKRMRKAPVEFWKPGKSDELRRAEWVYLLDWTASSNAVKDGPREVLPTSEPLPFKEDRPAGRPLRTAERQIGPRHERESPPGYACRLRRL